MLDMLKKLFIIDGSELKGKRDLLQESQDNKSSIDQKLYSEVKPYIDYILEKVNKEIMERARNGYYYALTGFTSFEDDTKYTISMNKEINELDYNHLTIIERLLTDKFGLYYSDKLRVRAIRKNEVFNKDIYISVSWEPYMLDKEDTSEFKKFISVIKRTYKGDNISLKDISDNSIIKIFEEVLNEVDKDIQLYVSQGKTFSVTSFTKEDKRFSSIDPYRYDEVSQYVEKRLNKMYKNKVRVSTYMSWSFYESFTVSVHWK